MSSDYTAMWQELGLDLEAHDALLEALSSSYQDIFLSQKNRPQGMQYLDFVMSEVHGLRIKELLDARRAGRPVVGSFCVFVPEEIILAADGIHVGLCAGAEFGTEEVEKILPRNTCALIKSAFGFKLSRVCPFIEAADMVVGENTCDGKKKSYEQLGELLPNLYVMDLPQQKTAAGKRLLREEYVRFLHAMEELSGITIDAKRLRRGVELVNAKRAALARLNRLRSSRPSPISGLDALLINQVSFYDDPVRFTGQINSLCDELEARIARQEGVVAGTTPRVLLSGCPMAVPNWKIPMLIERSGAVVVGEESCVGERGSRNLTDASGATVDALLDAIVERYFAIDCAVFTPNREREQHVVEMVQAYQADGVIHYGLQFCQPYLIESMPMEQRLTDQGITTLRIETDYSMEDLGQLQTRIEAFVEMLG
ncbi:MAG: 2-hydroxyacyl-CoA dehydratase [Deltaproteobacteria bacterium]|nr:2-hydroxyacyl-CoA dehydratase [Candidatus Anaeroferrophillus wilburensis]MBN2888608.1 2-hydroxyacyl-CoA dehydratase [Deltaproteobacteria bacterium]